jgi:D-3-phosphoglycerate dehydrogenase
VSETHTSNAFDFTDLIRVRIRSGENRERVVGTVLGRKNRPHLLEAWGQRFNLQIDDPYLALFRYRDVPGMVGRVGSSLGEAGVNISAAAVGRQAPGEGESSDLAVMAITTDGAVPDSVIAQIASSDGFVSGRSIALG